MTSVEEFNDTLLAFFKVSNALDFKLMEWKTILKFPCAGAVVNVTYIHYPAISMVKTWVLDGPIGSLHGKIT